MNKSEVLAVVGSREITRTDVDLLLSSLNPQTAGQFQSEAGIKNLVKELVSQELFYLDAVESGVDKEAAFALEVERMKENMLKQYAVTKLLREISVSQNEIENYYSANKASFAALPSVKASHILVDTLEEAEDIANKINDGLSFEAAAMEYSKCPSKDRGGDLGYFARGRMVPEFENAAFDAAKGQTTAPVKTQFGYHLIKVYDIKEEAAKTLDEVRGQIRETLLSKKQQDAFQSRVEELKGKYPVKISI